MDGSLFALMGLIGTTHKVMFELKMSPEVDLDWLATGDARLLIIESLLEAHIALQRDAFSEGDICKSEMTSDSDYQMSMWRNGNHISLCIGDTDKANTIAVVL